MPWLPKTLLKNPLNPKLFRESPIPFDHTIWIKSEVWLHKPPLSLWQMAVSIKLFGSNYFAIRLPMVLMHALLVVPIYRIGKLAWNEKTGFFAAIIFCFLNYPLELVSGYHTSEHVDMTFLFYITCSIWVWFEYQEKKELKWLMLIGVFAGFAVLTKWLVGLLVFAGMGLHILANRDLRQQLKDWTHLAVSFAITTLIVLPWHLYTSTVFPNEYFYEMQFNNRHFTTVVEGHGGDYWYYWNNLSTLYGSADLLSFLILTSLVFSWKTLKQKKHTVFLYTIFLVPYLFFTLAKTKMPSFLVILSPMVILISVAFVFHLLDKLQNIKPMMNRVFFYLSFPMIFMLCILLLDPDRVAGIHFSNHDTFPNLRQKAIDRTGFIQSQQFNPNEKIIIFVYDEHALYHENIHWMFYHKNVIAYDFDPDEYQHLLENYVQYKVKGRRLIRID